MNIKQQHFDQPQASPKKFSSFSSTSSNKEQQMLVGMTNDNRLLSEQCTFPLSSKCGNPDSIEEDKENDSPFKTIPRKVSPPSDDRNKSHNYNQKQYNTYDNVQCIPGKRSHNSPNRPSSPPNLPPFEFSEMNRPLFDMTLKRSIIPTNTPYPPSKPPSKQRKMSNNASTSKLPFPSFLVDGNHDDDDDDDGSRFLFPALEQISLESETPIVSDQLKQQQQNDLPQDIKSSSIHDEANPHNFQMEWKAHSKLDVVNSYDRVSSKKSSGVLFSPQRSNRPPIRLNPRRLPLSSTNKIPSSAVAYHHSSKYSSQSSLNSNDDSGMSVDDQSQGIDSLHVDRVTSSKTIQNVFSDSSYGLSTPIPSPHVSFTLTPKASPCSTPKEYQSPHWSKGVQINPFSPLPKEYYTNTKAFPDSNDDDVDDNNQSMMLDIPSTSPPRSNISHLTASSPQRMRKGRRRSFELSPPSPPIDMSTPHDKYSESPTLFHLTNPSKLFSKANTHHRSPTKYHPLPITTNTSNYNENTFSRFENDFQSVSIIGNGTFGQVYKVISRLDGCFYAVKVMKNSIRGEAHKHHLLKEVHALAALCDLSEEGAFHIVRFHQAWIEDERLYIQTELCHETLSREIETRRKSTCQYNVDLKLLCKLAREILLALAFIHRHDMVHLDIKPDNIFLKDDKYKLGDFGLAIKIGNVDTDVEEGDSKYMAKEMLSFNPVADLTKCDIFSFGVTLYEVYTGKLLPSEGEEWQDIRKGKIPFPENISNNDNTCEPSLSSIYSNDFNEFQKIIKDSMNPMPEMRPSAIDLLKRPLLLSDEQRELLMEKRRVQEEKLMLAAQKIQFKRPVLERRSSAWI